MRPAQRLWMPKRKSSKSLLLQSLRDHARQKHSMKVDLKKKTGKFINPIKCPLPLCGQEVIRHQILLEHLKNQKIIIHNHYHLDNDIIKTLVDQAVQDNVDTDFISSLSIQNYKQQKITTKNNTETSTADEIAPKSFLSKEDVEDLLNYF